MSAGRKCSGVEQLDPLMERIFQAKEERRKRLAALPWPEKVRILVQMQRMIVPIIRDRDPRACVWDIPEADEKLEQGQAEK